MCFCIKVEDGTGRSQLVELVGHAPLAELKGYSTYLRTITSGET